MANTQFGYVTKGYGQVEPNHLSAQRTGQIYAQLPAKADIALPSLDGMNKSAKKIVLAGDPKDKNARPVESAIEVNESFANELPAYSFTVIRIQKEIEKK